MCFYCFIVSLSSFLHKTSLNILNCITVKCIAVIPVLVLSTGLAVCLPHSHRAGVAGPLSTLRCPAVSAGPCGCTWLSAWQACIGGTPHPPSPFPGCGTSLWAESSPPMPCLLSPLGNSGGNWESPSLSSEFLSNCCFSPFPPLSIPRSLAPCSLWRMLIKGACVLQIENRELSDSRSRRERIRMMML